MILVNGDSVTFGDGIDEKKYTWPSIAFDSVVNIAESGSSNSSIYRRSVETLILKHYDTLIVGWTSLYRYELGDNYSKPKTILLQAGTQSIEKELLTNWSGEYWFFKGLIFNIYNLYLYTQSQNIKFY